jgi:CRP/FNR family cyclic AMP-dependent transcriptional regulator
MEISVAADQRLAGVNALPGPMRRSRPGNAKSGIEIEQQQSVDAERFVGLANVAGKVRECESKETAFSQGDPAVSVLFIKRGGVKLTVVNEAGKEAVVALLGPGDFFGEGCLAGQPQRVNTASTITRSTILVIEKLEMIQLLRAERVLSDQFIKHLLSRNTRVEEDLIDQLFNHTEKRLARTLLLLARYDKHYKPATMVPDISQETLAELIGTTRSRVNLFMNKFRKLGFIDYGNCLRGLQINKPLLSVVLKD